MIFKDIKQGYTIYLFDRNTIEVTEGKVTAAGASHLDKMNSLFEMVVDITIDASGKTQTYTFKDSNEVGYAGQLMITPNRDAVIKEIQVLKSQAEDALSKVNKEKETVEKCTSLLSTFDPVYKEKKETDERFNKLEQSINDIKELLSKLNK